MRVIEQAVQVSYRYPVHFTAGLFSADNAILRDVLLQGAGGRPATALCIVEREVIAHHPGLTGEIAAYFARLADAVRLVAPPVIVEGGEVVHAGTLAGLRSGPEGLVVEVDERMGELVSLLAGRGLEVTADEGRILVGAASPDAHDAVRDAVAELGVGLRRLEPRGRTLEDVYLGEES